MSSHADKGATAMAAKDYPAAIEHYTAALKTNIDNLSPVWLIARSTAYQRSSPPQNIRALLDAEAAVLQAQARGRRELIAQAQLRRAIALDGLRRYGDSRLVLTWVRKLQGSGSGDAALRSVGMWAEKVKKSYDASKEDGWERIVVVEEWPEKNVLENCKKLLTGDLIMKKDETGVRFYGKEPGAPPLPMTRFEEELLAWQLEKITKAATEASDDTFTKNAAQNKKFLNDMMASMPPEVLAELDAEIDAEAGLAPAPAPKPAPAAKIRHDWYQSTKSVNISILAKGIPKDKAEVKFTNNSVEVSFPTSSGNTYDFSLTPTYGPIDPATSKFTITPNKLELVLQKTTFDKWKDLEGTDAQPTISTTAAPPAPALIANKPPSYPTSSKHGPKNWDALAKSELAKTKASASSSDPSNSPNASELDDDLDDEADPLSGFFKKIYKDADPDTRRAMMKSMQESGGTALSTNWEEVGKGTVGVRPPEGMVERRFEQ